MHFTPPEPERRPIRVLPRDLAEKIAAGEVVERPSSVVKELVENSIDAGARHIRVEIEDGGRKKIVVIDDGHGIPREEIALALERHATSKIEHLADLWNLNTMGFRGEALPSIAAVSRFSIESGEVKLYVEGGKPPREEAINHRVGTQVTVEDLFFNVPARLKFLKARSSESAAIRELLERISLCHPGVAFSLLIDGRKSLSLAGAPLLAGITASPGQVATYDEAVRVAAVFETKPTALEAFESQFEDVVMRGWLDRDGRASNSRYVFLSVNKRMVRDKLLQQAVLVALRPRMMEGEYPRVYVAVEVPPGDVDANVHPSKQEVRFKKTRDIFQVVHGAIDQLARTPKHAFYSTSLPEAPAEQAKLFARESVLYKTKSDLNLDVEHARTKHSSNLNERAVCAPTTDSPGPHPAGSSGGLDMIAEDHDRPAAVAPDAAPRVKEIPHTRPGFGRLHYIGQLKNTYLLFQDGEGLVLIDQHAAHERINYERIKNDFLKNGLRPQSLLLSMTVKCRAEDIALALDHADDFTRLGFEFEAFGDNCLIVRSAPEGISDDRAGELFRAVLDELRDADGAELAAVADPSRLSARLERVLATAACHGSVRAGQALAPREASSLAAEMDVTESSLNCPHGRPASIRLTYSQIEGLFKR